MKLLTLVRPQVTTPKFDFKKVKNDEENGELRSDVFSLSCQVDGFLKSKSTFRAQSILEAKALMRDNHELNVYWQETMELVTALLNAHPFPRTGKPMQ